MIKSRHSKMGSVIKVDKNQEGQLRFLSTLTSDFNVDLITPTKFLSTSTPSLGFDHNTPCSKCLSALKFSTLECLKSVKLVLFVV